MTRVHYDIETYCARCERKNKLHARVCEYCGSMVRRIYQEKKHE